MSRFEVPSPPRRKVTMDDESDLYKPKADRQSRRGDRSPSAEPSSSRQRLLENMKDRSGRHEKSSRHLHRKKRRSSSRDHTLDDNDSSENKKEHIEEHHHRSSRQSYRHKRRSSALDYSSDENGSSEDKKDRSDKHHKSSRQSYQHGRKSTSHDYSSDDKSSVGRGYSHKHTYSRKDERRSPRRNRPTDE